MIKKAIKLQSSLLKTYRIKSSLTLIELLIVIGLVSMMMSVSATYGLKYWQGYRLEQSAKALESYLKQVEVIAVMMQADFKLHFTQDALGMKVHLDPSFAVLKRKTLTDLTLTGVERFETKYSSIRWVYGAALQEYTITLLASGQRREVRWLSHILLSE